MCPCGRKLSQINEWGSLKGSPGLKVLLKTRNKDYEPKSSDAFARDEFFYFLMNYPEEEGGLSEMVRLHVSWFPM